MQEPPEQQEPERSEQSPSTHRRDGTIEFSSYSTAQLEDLKFTIDATAFPQSYAHLCAELERRNASSGGPVVEESACEGRFTRSDGMRGWLQAKLRRSAVYGAGAIDVDGDSVVVHGWSRTWLGVGQRAELRIPLERVRNVALDDKSLEFEYKRPYLPARRLCFEAGSAAAARSIESKLPRAQTRSFQKGWREIREFNRRLRAASARVWVTPSLVVANAIVFAALAIVSRRLGEFDAPVVLNWGANFGPLTVNGQWWRTVVSMFLHLNAVHVLLNMWALWNVGRLTERLYGTWPFVLLYFASGVLASLTSVAWDPSHFSVGASGAIFGLFGSFLAFLAHPGNKVPRQIVRAHWLSTLLFVAFNLISGMMQSGIDNAAHVGGLLAGFILGWVLVRPLGLDERRDFPLRRIAVATSVSVAVAFAAVWQVIGFGAQLTPSEQFFRDHTWYTTVESQNLRRWQELAEQAARGVISEAELGRQFETEIVPFWKNADERLKAERDQLPAAETEIADLVAKFVNLRLQWSTAVTEVVRKPTREAMDNAGKLVGETERVQARVERVGIRASMEHRQRALAESWPFADIRDFLTGSGFKCVHGPVVPGREAAAAADNAADGPAQRRKAGCDAQRLFGSRRYAALDSLLVHAAASLGDSLDGGSTLDGIMVGLSEMTEYGPFRVEDLLGRTADWRRAAPGSIYPDLMEALVFEGWAWAARGHGAAKEVSAQAWALFAHRTEMAAATLDAAAAAGAESPIWYQLSLDVGLDKSRSLSEQRATADTGLAKFPGYRPLYRRMLRSLMPRWSGSYEAVNQFIAESTERDGGTDTEKYALLYWQYASLEGDDANIFRDGKANWATMKEGFLNMVDHYPESDAVLNGFAMFACITGDARQYKKLRPQVANRVSSVVWSEKTSLDGCNKEFD